MNKGRKSVYKVEGRKEKRKREKGKPLSRVPTAMRKGRVERQRVFI